MFNNITAEYIKNIPPIEGVKVEHLPQILSRIYANILALRTKYADDVLHFPSEELRQDVEFLGKLSLTLEVYLESRQYDKMNNSIAYVAALAQKLLGKLTEASIVDLSFYELPSELVATLLFAIGHYFADAEETARHISWKDLDKPYRRDFVKAVSLLAQGHIDRILSMTLIEMHWKDNPEEYAESLLWNHLTVGIVKLARVLSGGESVFDYSYFGRVTDLSSYTYEYRDSLLKHVYTSPNRLSRLLIMASQVMLEHAVINIQSTSAPIERWNDVIRRISLRRPFLWDNHKDALDKGFLSQGVSSVITYPTGAGKSTLVELKIAQTVFSGGRVVYIVPTHALEYQVARNISSLLGIKEKESLVFDGEFTTYQEENTPVWIMTPERCTTIMTLNPGRFDDVRLVVMDEFHIISRRDKGGDHRALGAMLCLLSFFFRKPDADYVLISAMVENGKEISNWIKDVTKRECLNLSMSWKPTSQLQGCLMYQQKEIDELQAFLNRAKKEGKTKNPSRGVKAHLKATPLCLFSLKSEWDSSNLGDFYLAPLMDRPLSLAADADWNLTTNKNNISMQLAAKFASLGMKTIVFIDKPSIAQTLAKEIQDLNLREANPSELDEQLIRSVFIELGGAEYSYISPRMSVAVHHSGLLPEERRVMESFFRGTVDVIAATPTLAQGVNLPVDVVIISGEMRFDQDKKRPMMISAEEILNATGRAGRAGFSSQGASILVPSHVIGYDGEPTSRDWYKITDEIFAKGDQCLTVTDPINKLLADVLMGNPIDSIQYNTLLKLNCFKAEGEKLLSNALFAYILRKKDRERVAEQRIKKALEIASGIGDDIEDESWVKEVAFKTGVSVGIIQSFKQQLEESDFETLLGFSVSQLISYFCSWLEERPRIFEQFFIQESTIKKMRKLLNGDESRKINESGINQVEMLLQMYVSGATLYEMNNVLGCPEKPGLLEEARFFVLKVLPWISYAFGALSLTIIEFAKSRHCHPSNISNEVMNLATYLKEGVLSEKMLQLKVKRKLMRVEAHQLYREIE